jgi:MoxR-like ATPase
MPGDVTGSLVYDARTAAFSFREGPVFTNLLLADEINRTPPKTQSSLLEAMEERQVTVDGRPHPVPNPFLVLATQNPVEMDGTYPLPEAQLDRFLIKTQMGYPDHDAEVRVLSGEHSGAHVDSVERVSSPDQVRALIAAARRVNVAPSIMEYIVSLVGHTRSMPQFRLGASPRGALGLLRAARVRAAMQGRPFVGPSDVQALVQPVLAHRVLISATFEVAGGRAADALAEAVAAVPAPPLHQGS